MMSLTSMVGGGLVASLLLAVLKKILGKLEGRWGRLATQVVLLCFSFAVVGVGLAVNLLPEEISSAIWMVFASGIALYDVFYKSLYKKGIKGK